MQDGYTARIGLLKKQTHLTDGESLALNKLLKLLQARSLSDVIRQVLRDRMKAEGLLN